MVSRPSPPAPAAAPWERAQRYAATDYTDLMD